MTAGFIEALMSAPNERALFIGPDKSVITAGQIRMAGLRTAKQMQPGATFFLHTDSAALFAAGLLVGALTGDEVAVLPQVQPGYLEQAGVTPDRLLSDTGDNPQLILDHAVVDGAGLGAVPMATRLVFFTSGSTETPKRVEKTLRLLEVESQLWRTRFADEVVAVAGTVSHQHIYGCLFRVTLPVIAGWLSQDRQAFTWETFIDQMDPKTLGVTSPAHLTRIPPGLDLTAKRPLTLLSSGGLLPQEAAIAANSEFGAFPIEILGSTETGGVATRQNSEPDTSWTPLPGVELSLDDAGVLQVASAQAGEGETVSMGDRAEIDDAGQFRLLARADRVAKVEGKRVSLARIETALEAHAEIQSARVLLTNDGRRDRLGAVIVLNEEGRRGLGPLGAFRFSREILRSVADKLEPAERPKRWRFASELPRNTQGKTTAAALQAAFDTPSILEMLAPQIVSATETSAQLEFELQPTIPWFEGHFPGRPLLPGLAQVHIAARLSEEIWAFAPCCFDISKMKFHRILFPGDRLTLKIDRDVERGRVRFAYHVADKVASEGVIGR